MSYPLIQSLDEFDRHYTAEWRFEMGDIVVLFVPAEEYEAPADHFESALDIAFASDGDPAHWFCAFVTVYWRGDLVAWDSLGCCSYGSFREFHSAYRWQYSRTQKRWITDPKSRAWKALERRRPRREDGSRMDGHYFPDMVRTAIAEARRTIALRRHGVA